MREPILTSPILRILPVSLMLAVLLFGCDAASLPTSAEEEPVVTVSATVSSESETMSFWDGTPQDTSGGYELEVIEHEGSVCYLVTFEGGGQFSQIHPENDYLVPGTPIRFSTSWATFTNTASLPQLPSGITGALWGFNTTTGDITFEVPVARINFWYLSVTDVTLNAYDANNQLVTSASGSADLTAWTPLGVDVGVDVITRAEIVS